MFSHKYIHRDKNAHCEAVVNGIHMSVVIHLLSAYLFDVSITLCVTYQGAAKFLW